MKEKYIFAEMEIEYYENTDILTDSGITDGPGSNEDGGETGEDDDF